MPSLVANYQEKALITQFKKTYSNLQNAINFVNVENGEPYECYYLKGDNMRFSQCNQFYDALFKKLQVINHCNYRQPNCFVNYKTQEQVIAEGGRCLNMCSPDFVSQSEVYSLSDGSTLYVLLVETDEFNNPGAIFIGVDINGKKGPNRWGYDMFYLITQKDPTANTTTLTALYESVEKGGHSVKEMMLK